MLPPNPPDTAIDRTLIMVIVLLFWGYAILLLVRLLKRSRPELAVSWPLMFGFALRVLVIAAVTATGIGQSLRGGDEITFLTAAHQIAASRLARVRGCLSDHMDCTSSYSPSNCTLGS